MKPNKPNQWQTRFSVALGASVIATMTMLPTARAELVYEPEVSPNAPAQVRQDDREQTRQALDSSQRAQNTVQATQVRQQPVYQQPVYYQQPAPQPVAVPVAVQFQPQVQVAPTQDVASPQIEVQSLSKTELMRRERTREELKNEDILQERLEELRLRDEKKRTQQLLGDGSAAPGNEPGGVVPVEGLAIPPGQVVVAPQTDRPGQPAPEVAPVPTQAQAQQYSSGPYTQAAQDKMNTTQAAQVSIANPEENRPSQFYVSPHAGISSMSTNSGFQVNGHYAVGVSAGVAVSDNIALEVGYTYAEYGVDMGNSIQAIFAPGTQFDTYILKQNVIDATLKLYLLGPDSKIRPFVGGGGGYSIGYLNYPSNVPTFGLQSSNQNYQTNSFLGEISTGLDVKVSKAVSIGAAFKYYTVLSSSQNNNLQFGAYGYGPAGLGPNLAQAQTGAALGQTGFYSITAGVNFSF
jgi:outer membrane protein W